MFRSHSDTEVLLHAWVEWGAECLSRLNGIFAFAVWDSRRHTLYIVRDRLGVKPLYYILDDRRLLFCSEIKGLLAVVGPTRPVNEPMVYDYLTSGRQDHTDETFFEGIRKLPAGHLMEIRDGRHAISSYWSIPSGGVLGGTLSENAVRFHDLFHDAIELQMRSDVAVACCLSGGLDSSSVAAVASALSPYPMRAYTARFHDKSMDEWHYAEVVHRSKPVASVGVFGTADGFWRDLDLLSGDPRGAVRWPWCLRAVEPDAADPRGRDPRGAGRPGR